MAFAEDRGADNKVLARQRLGRETATLNHRLYGSDGESAKAQSFRDVRVVLDFIADPAWFA